MFFLEWKPRRMLLQVLAEASEYIILLSSFLLRTNPMRLVVVEYYFHFKYQIMLDKSNILASRTCKSVPFLSFYSFLKFEFYCSCNHNSLSAFIQYGLLPHHTREAVPIVLAYHLTLYSWYTRNATKICTFLHAFWHQTGHVSKLVQLVTANLHALSLIAR